MRKTTMRGTITALCLAMLISVLLLTAALWQRHQLTSELHELKTGNAELTEQLAAMSLEKETLLRESAAAKEDLDATQAALDTLQGLPEALDAVQTDYTETKRELLSFLLSYRDYLTGELSSVRAALSTLTTAGTASPAEIDAAWAKEADLSGRLAAIRARIAVLEADESIRSDE